MDTGTEASSTYQCHPCPMYPRREIDLGDGTKIWEVEIRPGQWTRVYHKTRMHFARDENPKVLAELDQKRILYILI